MRNMRERIVKKLKKGGGELIGFCLCIPFLFLVFTASISVAQIGMLEETLEYAVYTGARAAIVSERYDTALSRADTAINETLVENGYSSGTVTLTYMDTDHTWVKGAFIKCEVSVYQETALNLFNGTRTASIIMMIERPSSL